MSRPDTLHPQVPGVAGNIAAFAAIYRFDFDAAHRLLDWASPYNEMMGPFSAVYARCYGGIADRYRLDIPAALTNFREAVEIATGAGPHSHAVRLASALLGQLLYETGDLAEATRLLEESYQFGSEGGGVDYLAARFVMGARIRALHGDRSAAIERLDAGMDTAQRLRLPRLEAAVNNQRIRLGIQIAPAAATRLRSTRTIPHNDGIATLTAELDEDSAVRLLAASDSPDDPGQACRRAAELAAGIDGQRRPLAALQAELLQIETLTATGRVPEARAGALHVSARCAEVGLPRLLVDAGLS
jgi:serine/threonine-protein kinase PknK